MNSHQSTRPRLRALSFLAACAVWALALCGCSSAPTEATQTSSSELTTTVCASVPQNQTASITCPAGQVVTAITFASFGTPTGTCGSFKTGSCNATNSVSIVSAACLGKASCSVAATTTVFGNPCSGTSKTLDIQVTCSSGSDAGASDAGHDASDASHDASDASDARATDASHDASDAAQDASDASGPPPGVICGSAPQNGTVSLSCPTGQVVGSIQFASFGTPTGTCGSFKTGSCNATNSVSIVSAACVGKASCSIAATTTVFGNPCSGVSKTLDVQALCQSSGCTISGTFYPAGATTNNGCEVCNPAVSTTAWSLVTDGTSCNDGNACTQTDSCKSGACVGANPVVCTASDTCHGVGTCNPANGVCSNPAQPNGTGCNDGNACTRTDTCQSGACVGGNPVSCAVADECHLAGTCNRATGTCPARPDGAICTGPKRCTSYSCVTGNCTPSATQTCTIVDDSGPTYNADCQNLFGVPLPPPWGQDSIGPPGATCNGVPCPWTYTGSDTLSDAYTELGFGNIYYATPSTVDGLGVCVINMSTLNGEFDLICQGPKGKACFWAGFPFGASQTPAPPATSVSILDSNWTGTGVLVTHSTAPGDITSGCTTCHMGENAFFTHYTPAGHPLSLNHPASLNGAALPGWMPTSWFDPVMSSDARHNPGPNPYVGYYPKTSTSSGSGTSPCLTCHTQTNGGRFPVLANDPVGGNNGSFCSILETITQRPPETGGMPPLPNPQCTPSDSTGCAYFTDSFVQAMVATCHGLAVSFANSPVAVDANVPSNPGLFDYLITDTETTVGSPTFEVMDNLYTNGFLRGWEVSQIGFNGFYSRFRATAWVKNLGGSTDLAYATNDAADFLSGKIWERTGFGNVRDVTQNSPVFAAGSPSGYVRHDGINAIVFRGSDQVIYESYWNSASATWLTSSLFSAVDPSTPPVAAQGDPIGYKRSGSSSSVVYKCGDQLMCELRLVDRWYFRSFPTAKLILQYVPMPIGGAYNGQHTIFYSAPDGVHALEDACEPWFSCGNPADTNTLFPDTKVMSAPIPYNDQSGGTSVVYIADGGGGSPSFVVQLSNDGAGWTARTLAQADKATETFVGDPAAYLASGPHLSTILFRNSTGTLYQLQWDPASASYVKSQILF
jgi:hypothetical protein